MLGVPQADRNRADVAQQYEDRVGRPNLANAIQQIISDHFREPSLVHKLIASLAQRHARHDIDMPVVAFTTNYDDVLEMTLNAAAVPFHLFLYQPDAGRFVHRSPDGRLHRILNPDGGHRALIRVACAGYQSPVALRISISSGLPLSG